jgi:hypothetical protein
MCTTKETTGALILTAERLEGNQNEIADIRYEISHISRLSSSEEDTVFSRLISTTSIHFTV